MTNTKVKKIKASAEKRKAKKLKANAKMETKILKILLDINGVATTKEIATEMKVNFQKVIPRLFALMEQGKITKTTQDKTIYWNIVQ